ncbi:PEP-utilizing enzyme, partial [Bacteroidota bacterium]
MNKKETLNLIENEKLVCLCAPVNYMNCYGFMKGFTKMKESLKEYFDFTIIAMKNNFGCQYNNKEKTFRIIKQAYDDMQKFEKIIKSWYKMKEEYYRKYDSLAKKIPEMKTDDLIGEYMSFLEHTGDVWRDPLITDAMGEYTETELLSEFEKETSGNGKENLAVKFSVLCQPNEMSFITREHVSLLKLAVMFKEKSEEFEEKLKEHQKNFFWIENNYAKIKVLGREYFMSKIKDELKKNYADLKQKLSTLEDKKSLRKKQEKLFEELSLSKELKEKILFTRNLGNWQDKRKEFCLRSNHYLLLFLAELSKRAGVSPEDSYYISPEEITGIIRKEQEVSEEVVAQRKKATVQIVEAPWKESLFWGDDALEILEKLDENVRHENYADEIKGVVASHGAGKTIKGRVRVIMNPENVSLKKNEILVTSMTRPDYVPLMKKAAAIITDEGGITSHASIVSRELGIP